MRPLLAALFIWPLCSAYTFAQDNGPPNLKAIIDQVRPSIATIKVRGRDGDQLGMGAGFVIDPDGLVATNFHVITEGRPFTVELASGRQLPVVSIEASDRRQDLAIIRVNVGDDPIPALTLSGSEPPEQGTQVLAFGNPLGLRDSVVSGIVSAVREIDDRQMIQLAMPTQPGNSGGPVVDSNAKVVGIVNMKSAVDDNLGFAIPIDQLESVRSDPNPISIDRWVRLGRIDPEQWTPLMGASWSKRGSILSAQGMGRGFGGRSMLLSSQTVPDEAFEVAVDVRLDDESGAAGLAFFSDGKDRHYGFYPSNGKMRLTCFKGPSVYDWQVLADIESPHYNRGQWNRLRVRVGADRMLCYVNGELVIESNDRQLRSGQVGLVKFRDTNPEFKRFQLAEKIESPSLSAESKSALAELINDPDYLSEVDLEQLAELGQARAVVSREISREVRQLEDRIAQLRRVAEDLELVPTLNELRKHFDDDAKPASSRLLRATLTIAKLDQPDLDVSAYVDLVREMADEIRQSIPKEASAVERREALHQYLFEENGFRGGRAEYYHPANSHLNQVIDDREGLPITLSILYMSLGQQLDLEIEGIGLPGHFVVRDVTDGASQLIDVFERGELMSRQEAEAMVASYAGRTLADSDLVPQDDLQILNRVLSNLVGVAGRRQDLAAIHRYGEALVAIDPDDVQSRRLRAQVRMMTDRDEAALADFDWLLENETSTAAYHEAMALRNQLVQRMSRNVTDDSATDVTQPIDSETEKPTPRALDSLNTPATSP